MRASLLLAALLSASTAVRGPVRSGPGTVPAETDARRDYRYRNYL